MEDKIPQSAIDSIAQHINQRTNKSYSIPTVGNQANIETPQIFEIIPFDKIDNADMQVYAIDGSKNSHSFYNGVSIGLYRGGYVCFYHGKQACLNSLNDPVILGKSYTPQNLLVTCNEHLFAIYDELLTLPPVMELIKFFGAGSEKIFPFNRDATCQSLSNLLSFCQEVLEWALIYEVAKSDKIKPADIILRDGALRTPNIRQEYLVKLGKFISKERKLLLVGVTKNSPVKVELSYTFKQIDSYLQDKLKPQYPFTQKDPKRQKLCCWFEVPDSVLANAYSGDMFAQKALTSKL